MIPVVCFSSFIFGNWMLNLNDKNGQFTINYVFVFLSFFMIFNYIYLFYTSLANMIADDSINTNPQYLIIYTVYSNLIILVLNRSLNARHSRYFANELKRICGRTVESGRNLAEFWCRASMVSVIAYLLHYKYRTFSDVSLDAIIVRVIVPLSCCVSTGSTMECQYLAACHVLAGEFAAVNRRTRAVATSPAAMINSGTDARRASESLTAAAAAHCRLIRLVRLFNDEYGAPILLTTLNLLLSQIYVMNDIVSVVVDNDKFESAYTNFAYVYDTFVWTCYWLRFWWICYRVDGLTKQVHLTAKIMLEKDINSFPEETRLLALDFLDQLLHRHLRITAWGFYDVNNELLFMVLGYQFGLCLICTQFTTSGVQLVNSLTTVQKNYTSRISTD